MKRYQAIIVIVIGVLLFIVGCLFRITHWPDAFKGLYSGPILILIGILLLIFKKQKGESIQS